MKTYAKICDYSYNVKPSSEDMGRITNNIKQSKSREINFMQLSEYIKNGQSFILAKYDEDNKIEYLNAIALDVDSKENKITMFEMVAEINKKLGVVPIIQYRTFSDDDYTRFRLIYRIDVNIDEETYRRLYEALIWKFNKYLDKAVKNANRIWAGTNKEVIYLENDKPFDFSAICKLITSYENKLKREAKKQQQAIKQYNSGNNEFTEKAYIKNEFKSEVINYLILNINLKDFMIKHYGNIFKNVNGNLVGRCIFHGGDNPTALVISDKIYTCFTHCGTGNIISAARKVYNIDHFSTVALKLISEYNLNINNEWVVENE